MIKLPEGIGFTSTDFAKADCCLHDHQHAADLANAKLPALFEAWVKREGASIFVWNVGYEGWRGNQIKLESATHQAYLVLPTEISNNGSGEKK